MDESPKPVRQKENSHATMDEINDKTDELKSKPVHWPRTSAHPLVGSRERQPYSDDSLKRPLWHYDLYCLSVILKRTTDKDKRKNLAEAIDTFEEWVDDYKNNSRSKENFSYLPLVLIEEYQPLADKYDIQEDDFLKAYKDVDGDLKKLRVKKVDGKEITWDIERNDRLKEVAKSVKENELPLYETEEPLKGLPTKEHTHMIMLAYSSDQSKIKKCANLIKEKLEKE